MIAEYLDEERKIRGVYILYQQLSNTLTTRNASRGHRTHFRRLRRRSNYCLRSVSVSRVDDQTTCVEGLGYALMVWMNARVSIPCISDGSRASIDLIKGCITTRL